MKRSTKIWYKQCIAWVLIVLMGINAFAAVVGDNDGAAFITKAEFESLKNEFKNQINKYNSSLDNKIDGVIASYVAGIRIGSTKLVKNLVTNYSDICWKRNLDFYGERRDYTNFTIKTRTVGWFVPVFHEAMIFRNQQMNLHIQPWIAFLNMSDNSLYGTLDLSAFPDEKIWLNDYDGRAPGIWVFECKYDNKDEFIIESSGDAISKICSNNNYMSGRVKNGYGDNNGFTYIDLDNSVTAWTSIGSDSIKYTWNAPLPESYTARPWLETLTLGTNDIWHYRTIVNYGNSRNKFLRQEYWATATDFNFTAPVLYYSINNRWDTEYDTTVFTNLGNQNPQLFSNLGGHIYAQTVTNSTDDQMSQIRYVMFGNDSDLVANVYRDSQTDFIGTTRATRYDKSKYARVKINFSGMQCNGPGQWSADTGERNVSYPTVVPTIFQRPYFERATVSQISSALFKYNGNNLKIGDGIPITTSLTDDGKLTINFDYSINRLVESVPSAATKIKIDVKKSNFNSKIKDDYYIGKVDDSTTAVTLKDSISNSRATATTNKATKIVIEDVKEGDEVWLRIAPENTAGGLYAKMSNLKVYLESEG